MGSATQSDAWTHGGGSGFGRYRDADEDFHPAARIPGDSLTETWAYMWYIPEERISSIVYIWNHPNLNVISAGLSVWQGHKNNQLAAELFDHTAFMSAAGFTHGRALQFPNSLRVEILEPFQTIHITYDDPARGNKLNLILTGAGQPIMRENEKHFEQMLRSSGVLLLRGKEYRIGGVATRDRSWGELRPESGYPLPPYTWMTGVFPEAGVSWQASAHDDPARGPEWARRFPLKPEQVFKDGWIVREGVASRLKRVSKLTTRDPVTCRPLRTQMQFVDLDGREYEVNGEIIASYPWHGWHNMVCWICLTRWEWEGRVGYGDTQEVQWGDYVHEFRTDNS
jgi:hypothetical protein